MQSHGRALCLVSALFTACSVKSVPTQTPPPLAAVDDLGSGAGDALVELVWSSVPGANNYLVFRGTASGGPYTPLTSTTAGPFLEGPFVDRGVLNGTTYFYVIEAQSGSETSAYSNEAHAMPLAGALSPKPVVGKDLPARAPSRVCLAQFASADIATYQVNPTLNAPVRLFGSLTGLEQPLSIAVDDDHDEVFVSNYLGVSITVYGRTASGNVAPLREIASPPEGVLTQLDGPTGIAVDSINDEIFAANYQNNSITVHSRTAVGNVPPLRTIMGAATLLADPTNVALDAINDEIVVSNWQYGQAPALTVYPRTASGNVAPLRTISGASTALAEPGFVAVDPVNDEIAVADLTQNAILVFSRTADGDVPPLRVIAGGSTTLSQPFWLAIDAADNAIFAASHGAIWVFSRTADGDVAPLQTITSPTLTALAGAAVDFVAREILVVDGAAEAVLVFPIDATGDTAPLRQIGDATSGLARPVALAEDAGEIFVANDPNTTRSVTVYDADSDGLVTPKRAIVGALTQLQNPAAIAVDATHGEMIVANDFPPSIEVFDRDADGNVAPLRIITSSKLTFPRSVAYDPASDQILVADGAVLGFARTANGDVAPVRVLLGPAGAALSATSIAVDAANQELIVADSANNALEVFSIDASDAASPLRSIGGSFATFMNPAAVSVDAVGGFYLVPVYAGLLVFDRLAFGVAKPLWSLTIPILGSAVASCP